MILIFWAKKNGSVNSVLSTAHSEQIKRNWDYVKTLIDLIIFLAGQGLVYPGHLGSKDSNNQGKSFFFPYDNFFLLHILSILFKNQTECELSIPLKNIIFV